MHSQLNTIRYNLTVWDEGFTKHNGITHEILTLFFYALWLSTLYALVFGAAVTGTVNSYSRKWIAHKLNDLILTCHLAAKFIWKKFRTRMIVKWLNGFPSFWNWLSIIRNRLVTEWNFTPTISFIFFAFFFLKQWKNENSLHYDDAIMISSLYWNESLFKSRSPKLVVINNHQ